jgi:hypothetical protein
VPEQKVWVQEKNRAVVLTKGQAETS